MVKVDIPCLLDWHR